jgi:Replication-relaxation
MARPVATPTSDRPAVAYSRRSRLPRGPELLAHLVNRLTPRDRWLLRMLSEHRVLTTHQIGAVAFTSVRATTARLLDLYTVNTVGRFRPQLPVGSAPWHFYLDHPGAQVIAAEEGVTTHELGYRADRAAGVGHSLALVHDVGVNTLFTDLVAFSRRHPGRLLDWWAERRCTHHWGDLARPDGYGRWREPDQRGVVREIEFMVEFDTGTEDIARPAGKLDGYRDLATGAGTTVPVLYVLHSPRRESALHQYLAATDTSTGTMAGNAHLPQDQRSAGPGAVRVATTNLRALAAGPAGPVWLPADQATSRVRLADLAGRWRLRPTGPGFGTAEPGEPAPGGGGR